MITTLSFLLVTTLAVPGCGEKTGATAEHRGNADLEALYLQGRTYVEFRDAATRRGEAWHEHYANAQVPDALQTRARAVPGQWKLLVVAEDWCGDSANTIPYIAKLVDLVDNVDMRIVNSTTGREIMEAHPTPDGRAATPTVVLLTDDYQHAGCWIERPLKLATWFFDNQDVLDEETLYEQKYAWYAEDAGQETVTEIVTLLEAAAGGQPICGS